MLHWEFLLNLPELPSENSFCHPLFASHIRVPRIYRGKSLLKVNICLTDFLCKIYLIFNYLQLRLSAFCSVINDVISFSELRNKFALFIADLLSELLQNAYRIQRKFRSNIQNIFLKMYRVRKKSLDQNYI